MGFSEVVSSALGTLFGSSGDSTLNSDLRFYMGASALSAGYPILQPGCESPNTMPHIRPEPDELERLANHKFHELLDKFERLIKDDDGTYRYEVRYGP